MTSELPDSFLTKTTYPMSGPREHVAALKSDLLLLHNRLDVLEKQALIGGLGCDALETNFYDADRMLAESTLVGTTAVVKKGNFVLDMGITGSAVPRFASLPAVPVEFQGSIQYSQEGGGLPMFGIAYLDASNNGAGLIHYKNSEAANSTLRLVVITAGVYSSAPVIKTLFSAGSTVANVPIWLRLAKSGTTYTAYWSQNGVEWSGAFSTTIAGTPTKIAVGQFNRLAGVDNTTASSLAVRYLATPI